MNFSTNWKLVFTTRRALVLGAVVGLGVAALAIITATTSGRADAKAKIPVASMTVNVVAPMATTFNRAIAASGTVSARDELIIGSDASGVRLTEVRVDVGSTVERGQLLARADDTQLQAQLAQQEAQIKQAQAELTQAAANLERAERLKDTGVYSIEALQTRRTSAAAANAKLELALAQRREINVRIGYTRVLAPANGVISKKFATVGAVVQPGTELFRLIRDGELEWQAELPSHSLAKIQSGAKVRIALDGAEALEASVRQVAPTVDARTRNGLVYVELPRAAPLKAGSHVTGEIIIDKVQALAVPGSSVLTRDGYAFVYVVGADQVARQAKIETGARQRGLVEVTAGLPPDARVVSTGAGFLKAGDLVRVAAEPAKQVAQLRAQP